MQIQKSMHLKTKIVFFLLGIQIPSLNYNQPALTIVPIADLIGEPHCSRNGKKILEWYDKIPLCGTATRSNRIHQALFNEIVDIQEYRGQEVLVKINNVFFHEANTKKCCNQFWSLKKNFVLLSDLQKKNIPLTILPAPISYKSDNDFSNIATLAYPFKDPVTGITFSAATRFVRSQEMDKAIEVFVYNPKLEKIEKTAIPKWYVANKTMTLAEKRVELITLLRRWIYNHNGFIPYVWGGCSFIQLCNDSFFSNVETHDKDFPQAYKRLECTNKPYSGFDCAGLIWRAAQICEIRFYFKNSITIANCLEPISAQERLAIGDIIWFPGHVIIISDLKRNMIIEARSYNHGYGRVHELPLNAVFKNIPTFSALKEAHKNKQPLYRLNKEGFVAQTIPSFKLLKLSSAWHYKS